MKHIFSLLLIAVFSVTLISIDQADARRFGGGMSFGKQRMAQPMTRSGMQRQATPPRTAAQRGSARTGMMAGLAGLAMGGMLGAMLFGGAFEGINFFDILVIGGIIALIIMFMRRRSMPTTAYAGHTAPMGNPEFTPQAATVRAVRPDIDEKHFTQAAKDIYMRMQKAWDAGDITDIRTFCTPEITDRIAEEMRKGGTHETEIGMLNAEIVDSWMEAEHEWVAVNFTAMLREKTRDASGTMIEDRSENVNETWIFKHDPASNDPTWYLAGIQQA